MVFQMERWVIEQISCSKTEGLITFRVDKSTTLIKVSFDNTPKGIVPSATYIKSNDFEIPIEILHAFLAAVRRQYPNGI